MSAVTPPRAVIDTAAGAGGPVHVTAFLVEALNGNDTPTLHPRADLHKCMGGGIAACAGCARHLAPVAVGQQWTAPDVEGDSCSLFASPDRYRQLYTVDQVQEG